MLLRFKYKYTILGTHLSYLDLLLVVFCLYVSY